MQHSWQEINHQLFILFNNCACQLKCLKKISRIVLKRDNILTVALNIKPKMPFVTKDERIATQGTMLRRIKPVS